MTWGLITPCSNCKKKNADPPCKDAENIQKGLTECYKDYTTHQGSGNVAIICNKADSE